MFFNQAEIINFDGLHIFSALFFSEFIHLITPLFH